METKNSKYINKKNNLLKLYSIMIISLGIFIFNINFTEAAANFQVTSFSCSPAESVINSIFSCTSQIQNTGDAAGTLSTATLYPDSGNWLENSNYAQTYGSSINVGESISITFTGLRAIKSGDNGFSKIMLDSITDTYVADNNKKINIIDVVVTVSNSASSAAMNVNFDSTSEITAGGNVDVTLTFTSNSGGCSIGSQTNPKTITGMTDGSKQARTWTITQGTTGNCQYSVSASATGTGKIANKIDSTSSSVTCTNCPTDSSSSSSSSGGGSGGSGGAGLKIYIVGELTASYAVELAQKEKISFNISGVEHILTLINLTETNAIITIESKKQTFAIIVGNEILADLNGDNNADISVKLKSIDTITKKANLILLKVSGGKPSESVPNLSPEEEAEKASGIATAIKTIKNKILVLGIVFFIILAAVSGYYILKKRKRRIRGY